MKGHNSRRERLNNTPKANRIHVWSPGAATPVAFIQAILRAYERDGADPRGALRSAGIFRSELQHPQARITAAQMEIFSACAMRQLDDEALGWFSRKLPWGSYGMLCRASLTSPDLGVALKRWCRHHRILTDDIRLELTPGIRTVRLTIVENTSLGDMRELCLLTSFRYVHGFACWLLDSRLPLLGVEFPFRAPPHAQVYPLLFSGPVHFGAPRSRMTFDAKYMTLPLRRDERELRSMLRRGLLMTIRLYRSEQLVAPRLRDTLRARCAELLTGESVAHALNVSLRTLHRQLRSEGTSLQKLKNEVRRNLAIERLERTSRSVKQVAHDVGFRSEKSFLRAFKQWTGASPSRFRRAVAR